LPRTIAISTFTRLPGSRASAARRSALLGRLHLQLVDLAAMEEELARSFGIVVLEVAVRIRRDVRAEENALSPLKMTAS
jgi:hypothetical protein